MFLLGDGRLSQGLERIGLVREKQLCASRTAVAAAGLCWLPLLLLAAAQGLAWVGRVEVPLLKDFLAYGRFLLAVPVLILAEVIVGKRLGLAAAELRRSPILVPEDTPTFDALLTTAVARWRGRRVNVVLLVLTYAVTAWSFWEVRDKLTVGWYYAESDLSLAGWWHLLVSMPLLRFLMVRWLWRLGLWAWVLWRMSRLRLALRPTHPDRAGGLAFLGATQAGFAVVTFAASVQLACVIADEVSYRGADLMAFKPQVIAFVALAVVVLLLPLLVFAPKLLRAREEALVFLSGSGYQGAEVLDRKLAGQRTAELPAQEISALSDFGILYELARRMRPLPLEAADIAVMVAASVLPYVPLVFLVMPAKEVFQKLAGLLF